MINLNSNNLDVVLALCAATIGILAFANEFPERRFVRRIKTLPVKLILFVIATIIGIWATTEKNSLADKEKSDERLKSKNEQHHNDLANRKLTDQSNAKIVKAFTEALAKYNLKYDSTQKVVLKLVRDSSRKITQNLKKDNPNLDVCDIKLDKISNDTTRFQIALCATKSTAYNIEFKLYTAYQNFEKYYLVNGTTDFFPKKAYLAVDKKYTNEINFKKLPSSVNNIIFLFIGEYTDEIGKKFPLNIIYSYDLKKKIWGLDSEPYYSEEVDFFHRNDIKF